MRTLIVLLVCLASIGQLVLARHSSLSEWTLYKKQHGKVYETPEEDAHRYSLFMAAKDKIERHNQDPSSRYKLGLNHLSDWTEEEFDRLNEAHYNTDEASQESAISINPEPIFDLPDEADWRVVGSSVTPVKDQGKFSTGVAFAVAGSLEGRMVWASTIKELADLSVQNIIDCSNNTQDPFVAFSAVLKEGGIEADSDYPYEGSVSKCRFDSSKSLITFNLVAVPDKNEDVLKAVTYRFGPVTAGVSTRGWQNYKSGVFDSPDCGDDIDATVLIVGYGTDPKLGDYWLVKNSLSEKWGEQGYMRLQRGVKRCGIGSQITYPWFY
uniref:Cathepsin L n=1 Tax=Aceria tosichella TaxID=561515 RepID=A0A6G1SLE3_9ACAR